MTAAAGNQKADSVVTQLIYGHRRRPPPLHRPLFDFLLPSPFPLSFVCALPSFPFNIPACQQPHSFISLYLHSMESAQIAMDMTQEQEILLTKKRVRADYLSMSATTNLYRLLLAGDFSISSYHYRLSAYGPSFADFLFRALSLKEWFSCLSLINSINFFTLRIFHTFLKFPAFVF